MLPRSADAAPLASARPAHPAARERQQLARRLLREASLELTRLRRIRGAYKRTARRIAGARRRLALAAGLLGVPLAGAAGALTPHFVGSVLIHATRDDWASPTFGDIDGDGDLDALVADGSGFMTFFANTGTANAPAFVLLSTEAFGLQRVAYRSPAFADLDGDGDLDLFVGGGGSTSFFANTGTANAPAFAARVINPFGLANVGRYASLAFADLDGDGDLDALVGNYDGHTIFFENTGTLSAPAFAAPLTNPFGLADVGFYASPDFADLDGDGDLDAFVGEYFGDTVFLENTGTANAPAFAAPVANPFGLTNGENLAAPAFADIDDDGDLDAFVGNGLGSTVSFANTGTASAPAFAPGANPFGVADAGFLASPALADIDGDGDLDAFVGESDGNTIFFANTGTANAPAFGTSVANPFGLRDVATHASPAFADLDDDGDLDAFVGRRGGGTVFFKNTGTASAPAFAASVINPFGLATVGLYASPAFADIDGDGDLDAFVGNSSVVNFFANTGTTSAPAFATPSSLTYLSFARPAFADLDGDGDLDAFSGGGDGRTRLYANTGTASAPAFPVPVAAVADPFGLADVGRYASPDFGDIDGDGDLDAFVGDIDGNTTFFENVELGPGTCADGLDNDFDGQIDSPSDPGCANAADPNERSSLQCDNGLDDDGDGKIDWRGDASGDPHCASLTDDSEAAPPPTGCGLGPELLLLAPLLAAVRRRR